MLHNTSLRHVKVSYGIIVQGPGSTVLCVQRKDTIAFVDIVRGKAVREYDRETLFDMLYTLCQSEYDALVRAAADPSYFKVLWHDMWQYHRHQTYERHYQSALQTFQQMSWGDILWAVDRNLLAPEPTFGFPKGRKLGHHETDLQSALREFSEETGIDASRIRVVHNAPILDERHMGCDGKLYGTRFFLAKMTLIPPFMQVQKSEIRTAAFLPITSPLIDPTLDRVRYLLVGGNRHHAVHYRSPYRKAVWSKASPD